MGAILPIQPRTRAGLWLCREGSCTIHTRIRRIAKTCRITSMATTHLVDEGVTVPKVLEGPAEEGALRFALDSRGR